MMYYHLLEDLQEIDRLRRLLAEAMEYTDHKCCDPRRGCPCGLDEFRHRVEDHLPPREAA